MAAERFDYMQLIWVDAVDDEDYGSYVGGQGSRWGEICGSSDQ